jgi:hypothetical protein
MPGSKAILAKNS